MPLMHDDRQVALLRSREYPDHTWPGASPAQGLERSSHRVPGDEERSWGALSLQGRHSGFYPVMTRSPVCSAQNANACPQNPTATRKKMLSNYGVAIQHKLPAERRETQQNSPLSSNLTMLLEVQNSASIDASTLGNDLLII